MQSDSRLPKDLMRPVFGGIFIARWAMTIVVALPTLWIVAVQFAIVTQFVAVLLISVVPEVY